MSSSRLVGGTIHVRSFSYKKTIVTKHDMAPFFFIPIEPNRLPTKEL
jgi:hypothetical protein